MSDKTLKQISEFTSVLCRKMFEATEVKTPTCFVILPVRIDPLVENCEKNERVADLKYFEELDK